MREIEFRGKRAKGGEWVYGNYAAATGPDDETPTPFIFAYSGKAKEQRITVPGIKVLPETLGQYTGIKDKNGVKIFEGDIVRLEEGYPMFAVTWDGLIDRYYSVGDYPAWVNDNYEVIGNIHDDPELLEENQ